MASSTLNAPHDIPLDPTATQVNTSCLDFLLIELVPMAYRLTAELAAREEEWLHSSSATASHAAAAGMGGTGGGGGGKQGGGADAETSSTLGVSGAGSATGGSTGAKSGELDEEEAREAVFHRLEALGYRVGLGVVERLSRSAPRPTDPLSTIKFLCKDVWTLLFRKQIDNLKTNHRGIYVLTDNTFKPLTRMSFDTRKYDQATTATALAAVERLGGDAAAFRPDANSVARLQPFLYFPAGLVRGCLEGLGVRASVSAETSGVPVATFQIRTVGAKP